MNTALAILQKLIKLFVDDWLLAAAILLWIVALRVLAGTPFGGPSIIGISLFSGLAAIFVGVVARGNR